VASIGPVAFATFSDDSTVGTVSWLTPGNAAASDNTYATASSAATATSHYLKGLNASAGLSAIGNSDTVDGFVISVERKASINSADHVTDSTIRPVVGGTISGTNKADTTTNWGTSDTVINYGSSTDTWGLAGLTGADVKSSTFGVALSVAISKTFSSLTASVDAITLTVYYTPVTLLTIAPASVVESPVVGSPTITTSATVSPSSVVGIPVVGTPTITPGPVTVFPSSVVSTPVVGTPVVTPSIDISPSSIVRAPTVGTPTITSEVIVQPTSVVSTPTVGEPVVELVDQVLFPSSVVRTPLVGSPTVSPGALFIAPTSVISDAVVGTPTLKQKIPITAYLRFDDPDVAGTLQLDPTPTGTLQLDSTLAGTLHLVETLTATLRQY